MPRKPRLKHPRQPPPVGPPRPTELLWEIDQGTPEEAWRHTWWTGNAPIWFCLEQALAGKAGHRGIQTPLFDLLDDLESGGTGSPTDEYEAVVILHREIRTHAHLPQAYTEWLATGALCAEAMIASSSGGGLLYGTLLEATHGHFPLDGTADRLLQARERDAFGARWGPRFGAAVDGFRTSWRTGRYRIAYLIARAARGLP